LSTPSTRDFFSTPPTRLLVHIDDDELSKNKPIRIKQEIVHPRRILKLEDGGKREDSKLTKGKRREA
jgi:hypothetical protein